MEERLDKSIFKKQSVQEAAKVSDHWRSKSMTERLEAGYIMSLRAYGIDPLNPPPMDKAFFRIKKGGV